MAFDHLFAPLRIGPLSLPSRIAFTAHGTRLAEGASQSQVARGVPGPRLREYHLARARGGVGMIVVEPTVVFPLDRAFVRAWADVVAAVRDEGTPILAQLIYGGRQTTGAEMLRPPYAPSALPWRPGGEVPREMSAANVRRMVASYAAAAEALVEVGFDGVEVHGAHGYLVHEFLSPESNLRTDEYGGSTERRTRFPREVVAAVRERIGRDKALGLRLSVVEHLPDGLQLDEGVEVARTMAATGDLDYLSVSSGTYAHIDKIIPGMYGDRAANKELGRAVRAVVDIPVLVAGRITDPAVADAVIGDGCADLVAMTRALVADPGLPNKARAGRDDDIQHCMGVNQGCWGRVRKDFAIGCVLNPDTGRELDVPREPAATSLRVVVVGGGPAGCESARQAALQGHEVHLFEATGRLGGMVAVAAADPARSELTEVARWHGHELARLGVHVTLGHEVDVDEVGALRPDLVVVAVGAAPASPAVDGLDEFPYWMTLPDAMELAFDPRPRATIYSVGRGIEPLSLADMLARRGADVDLISPHRLVGEDLDDATYPAISARLHEAGVRIHTDLDLVAVCAAELVVADRYTGARSTIPHSDAVVIDVGLVPRRGLYDRLEAALPGVEVVLAGDCLSPRGLQAAVRDGARAGRSASAAAVSVGGPR